MTRKEGKPNTVSKRVKGKLYHYYRLTATVDGKRKERFVRIKAEPGTPEYDRLYWAIRSGKHNPVPVRTSFAALIENYMASRRYSRLADSTRGKYKAILDAIREKNGALDVTTVTRGQVEAIHDKYASTPRKADYYVQVLSILFNHAKRLEWMTHNPAEGVELFGSQREYEPWPEWFQAEYSARAKGEALALFYVGGGTGQRPGDVGTMRWDDFDGEYMTVKQEKTGTPLTVYCPAKLRTFLASWPKRGEYIFAKNLREPLSYDSLNKRFGVIRDAIAAGRPEAKRYTLHGLRYLAAIELAEAGCSDAEIQAVTGHKSLQMVQKYRAKASQKRLSKSAQKRREQTGGEG